MEANIAFVARLLADPTRAAMCLALAGGEARPAGELAARAGVSAQTASNHLAKLIDGRILRVEQQGRWRYYRLAGADVGHAVEALAVVAPPLPEPVRRRRHDGEARRLRDARTCYSHLAGRLGVALADALIAETVDGRGRPQLPAHPDRHARAPRARDRGARTPGAARGAAVPGLDGAPAARCRPVGTALANLAFDRGWVRRMRGTRAVIVTPAGRAQLQKTLQRAMGGEHAMITLSIRYTIDARKRADFERYARALGGIIPRCGGELVGYWLPTKFAGPTNSALALINFPSLAAYEQYRERLAKDDDNIDSVQRADESGCILVEDRAILERV